MSSGNSVKVVFADARLQKEYGKVKKDDPILYKFLDRAFDDIKEKPTCGISISKRLIPKEYIQNYGIDNLWKYDLPGAWRLLYSLSGTEVEIIAIVLEWLPHHKYERRFGYNQS